MTEAALKRRVGGKYETETLYYPDRTEQFRDRKIEIRGKAFGVVIRGKDGIAVCGLTDGILTSLHPYNAQTQKREMGVVEAPKPKKESVLDGLDVAKAEASAYNAAAKPADRPNNRGEQEVT